MRSMLLLCLLFSKGVFSVLPSSGVETVELISLIPGEARPEEKVTTRSMPNIESIDKKNFVGLEDIEQVVTKVVKTQIESIKKSMEPIKKPHLKQTLDEYFEGKFPSHLIPKLILEMTFLEFYIKATACFLLFSIIMSMHFHEQLMVAIISIISRSLGKNKTPEGEVVSYCSIIIPLLIYQIFDLIREDTISISTLIISMLALLYMNETLYKAFGIDRVKNFSSEGTSY